MNKKKVSKFISYILRHNPGQIGVVLEKGGWANTNDLIENIEGLDLDILKEIVSEDKKSRYSFKDGFDKIRANQGHSIDVDLGLEPITPPDVLYHGTSTKTLEPIMESGVMKMSRHHVHLSKDIETAEAVGSRHGRLVLLSVDSKKMYEDGIEFYLSDNGVWLTDYIDFKYCTVLEY